jgi:superfamily II DNA or RNA helicase
MSYEAGNLVSARGREWVVLPESEADFLVLRPLGGTDQEIAGIYLPLEGADVRPARFDPPDPARPGDFLSCRLLRDAVRLSVRSAAGPFRSAARINVAPRPYQLVPLLMALKLDPVRLLIADDVGIGKTIEAALVARELLDRGEVRRLAVLCPPHLAEQWQAELASKFHIQAEVVLASTASRLERDTAVGQSLFDLHPFVIVSTDYIKSPRRRDEFARVCPELVIVDEAHTCAYAAEAGSGRHLRHQLLRKLAEERRRHMLLVTATPHSGNEQAFRSLLGLLRPDFAALPEDLSGKENEKWRREVAGHLVQRRRADIRAYLDTDTPFPEREEAEETYALGPEYRRLFESLLEYARERILDPSGGQHRQRVRWWSALALLRSLASSPAAAAATLRARSTTVETEDAPAADAAGERSVLDLDDVETAETLDTAPGAQETDQDAEGTDQAQRERLLRFARQADALRGPARDAKLAKGIALVRLLLEEGFNPILFCRFIPTAEYLAEELRKALPAGVEVAAVTGTLPPAEREVRVADLSGHPRRVLVATDCLSEGINLQEHFDAVVHYDLSWNPTRHEQREGRVDRYGQPRKVVRAVTYFGADNQIDGIVLDVLIRKHRTIRISLGISVPVPGSSNDVVQALMNGLLLRGNGKPDQLALQLEDDLAGALTLEWDAASDREKRSRTLFAQHALDAGEVAREWDAVRAAIGAGVDVERFVSDAVLMHGGSASREAGLLRVRLPNSQALREACGDVDGFKARFGPAGPGDAIYLTRSHPIVEGLAGHVMDAALDPLVEGFARRCGAIRTRAVTQTTTLLLLRFRHHLVAHHGGEAIPLLAESCAVAGFRGSPAAPEWLAPEEAERLLQAQPDANTPPQQATEFVRRVLDAMPQLEPALDDLARARGVELLAAHERVRSAARLGGARHEVQPQLPPDLLGAYVLLPVAP